MSSKQKKSPVIFPDHNKLVEALKFQSKGEFTKEWVYADADGKEVFRVLRIDTTDSKKTFRPATPVEGGWVLGDPPGLLPLYKLQKIADASRVYVCEGEKCADAVESVGLIATTSAHGSKSARRTDWRGLAGKEVIICPDNDDPGEKYAEDVAAILSGLTPPASIKILRLPGLMEKQDIFDFIERHDATEPQDIRTTIETLANQAPTQESVYAVHSENIQLSEYHPFPSESLPAIIRDFVVQGAAALNCDQAYITLPLLAALAAIIGNTRRIVLRRDWVEPCVLWTASVGDSGSGKSPAQDLALNALRSLHSKVMKKSHDELDACRRTQLEYERELTRWKKSRDHSPPPQAKKGPVPPRYLCSDVTVEALAVILQDQPRGVLLERDELSGWLESFGAYKSGRGGDEAHWLSMYSARELTVDRKTGELKTIYIPRAAVSITGGIQPEILRRSLEGKYVENGLAARIFLAMPSGRKRAWTEAELDPAVKAGVGMIFEKLLELSYADNGEPMNISLSPEAKQVWIEFYDEHAEVSFQLTNPALKAAYAKLEGAAARLILVIHCIRAVTMEPGVQPNLVDEISAKMGVTLARWFRNETTRIYGLLGIGSNDRPQEENLSLVESIRKRGGRITPRELQQSSRQYRSSPKSAETALQTLVDRELGYWERSSPDERGGRPTKLFVLK